MATKLFVDCSSCEPAEKTTRSHLGCGIHGNFIFYCENGQFLEPLFATLKAVKLFVDCSSCKPAGKAARGHLGCGIQGNFIYYCQNRQFLEPLFATLMAVKLFVHCSSCEPAGKTTCGHMSSVIHCNFRSYWPFSYPCLPHWRQLSFFHGSSCESAGKTTCGHWPFGLRHSRQLYILLHCQNGQFFEPLFATLRQLSFLSMAVHASRQGRWQVAIWVAAFMATSFITVRMDNFWNPCHIDGN